MAASFPEASSIPAARLVKLISSPGSRPMEEPSTATISSVISTVGSPERSASSKVSRAVMILVVLAMESCR